MAASGCLPACPIEEWALLMHMFDVQSRRWIVEPYQPKVELVSGHIPPGQIPPGHIPTTQKKVMIDLIFKFER